MYDAVQFTIDTFLKKESIQDKLRRLDAVPTVVVLTDGFNNERKMMSVKQMHKDYKNY